MKLYSIRAFAALAHLHPKTVTHHINRGHIKTVKEQIEVVMVPASELRKLPLIVRRKSYPQKKT